MTKPCSGSVSLCYDWAVFRQCLPMLWLSCVQATFSCVMTEPCSGNVSLCYDWAVLHAMSPRIITSNISLCYDQAMFSLGNVSLCYDWARQYLPVLWLSHVQATSPCVMTEPCSGNISLCYDWTMFRQHLPVLWLSHVQATSPCVMTEPCSGNISLCYDWAMFRQHLPALWPSHVQATPPVAVLWLSHIKATSPCVMTEPCSGSVSLCCFSGWSSRHLWHTSTHHSRAVSNIAMFWLAETLVQIINCEGVMATVGLACSSSIRGKTFNILFTFADVCKMSRMSCQKVVYQVLWPLSEIMTCSFSWRSISYGLGALVSEIL